MNERRPSAITRMRSREKRTGAFTLLEVMVSSALGALAITAATFFVIHLMSLGMNEDAGTDPALEADALARVLQQLLLHVEPVSGTSNEGGDDGALRWRLPPNATPADPEVLSWRAPSGLPLYSASRRFSDGQLVHLLFDPQNGLRLVWEEELAVMREPQIRSWSTGIDIAGLSFGFYDSERDQWHWQEASQGPRRDEPDQLPTLLRLDFPESDGPLQRYVLLPQSGGRP